MSTLDRHGRAVAWDSCCGKPIAWVAHGEPVAGSLYGGSGPIVYTHLLTVDEAVEVYGPITEWVVGPQRGFRSVCFGETVFTAPELGRGFDTRSLPDGVVTVDDPDLEWPCPQCAAQPSEPCTGKSKHRVRRAYGEEYRRQQAEMAHLRETITQLRKQNEALDELVHALRKAQRKTVPICNRPTRAGNPCQADAILFPVPIESCRIHTTPDEKAILADAERQRRAEYVTQRPGNEPQA